MRTHLYAHCIHIIHALYMITKLRVYFSINFHIILHKYIHYVDFVYVYTQFTHTRILQQSSVIAKRFSAQSSVLSEPRTQM